MKNKGTALIVTLVYIVIVSIICVSVLGFGVQHYMLMSQRVDKFQNMYYAEGGLYLGICRGARGTVAIDTTSPNSTVTISDTGSDLESKRFYTP